MPSINLDLASFNVIKYTVITIFLTPLIEFLLHRLVLTWSKKSLIIQGAVRISKTRSGFWGLYSHSLGSAWYRRTFVIVPAVWVIASEILLEFSFDSSRSDSFEPTKVYRSNDVPAWSEIEFTQSDLNWIEAKSDYYYTYHLDYDMLLEGMFVCQKPDFRQRQEEGYVSIEQLGRWRRTHRNLNNISVLCGSFADVAVTARVTVASSANLQTPVKGVDFSPNSSESSVPEELRKRLIKFQENQKHLDNDLYVFDGVLDIRVSEDRVACVSMGITAQNFCVVEEADGYGLYFMSLSSQNPDENSETAKKLLKLFPHNFRKDQLLTIMEAVIVWMTLGTLRPTGGSVVSRFLTTRQVKELMQLYLSLDANGGHTNYEFTSVEDVADGESPIIVIKSTAYVALGLIAVLCCTLLTIIVGCHVVANRFRSEQLEALGVPTPNRKLALNDINFDLELGYLLSVIREELGFVSADYEEGSKSGNVTLRIVEGNDKGQRFEALREEIPVPRDYSCILTGHGTRNCKCCGRATP